MVFGCEIDAETLRIAQAGVSHIGTIFESRAELIRVHGPYDLIVCSAVLCLNPPKDLAALFPSARFDELLAMLDNSLAPGGLLAITNASYRFQAAPLARHYDAVRSDIVSSSGFVDVFAHDGRAFLERIQKQKRVIFRRGDAFDLPDEEELADSVFRKRAVGDESGARTLTLAAPPERFQAEFEYERSNFAELPPAERVDAIEVIRHYRFGTDAASGKRGYTVQTRWITQSGKTHVRPAVWSALDNTIVED